MDLSLTWAIIILFGIMMYIIMDGFDLGIGILYPFFTEKSDRDLMMNTVAPVWDGNETWLVLGGAGLLAAFPLAYSVILSALSLPLLFMLMALIFRGVAFEFRFKANESERHFWDKAFIGGSIAATFFQGMTLGAYLQGIKVVDQAYAGGALDWISPFSTFTGLGLLVTYALLGSTWLILKTSGDLQSICYKLSKQISVVLLGIIVVISLWTPWMDSRIAARWFSMPNILWLSPVPVLVGLCFFQLQRALQRRAETSPFIYTLGLVMLGYAGLGISIWPNIIPPNLSIQAAAAPASSQQFALVGALIIIPMILMYTAWGYYIFRGKVSKDEAYH
ncbi:cytochrome d ubiquinol oxidase subunit II [Methylophilus medardicus]|uniref:Cytochrome d ubiquinol oxidase subunit II n=1 Tax=Methylophilus medardicus TaxID=2588534 RepID=A0A5B8CS49_9PROT|nr:cytochrome d ubiquinol oxidase subunit II [Methylophilus medardicus]QDC43950.1 cytochrome d ubiquinol oxidase subunit II [Methylophilus medardicus]QDC48957.1 cytochrome d ubiquinol oxidase subunit II [Methylophilus medardicus]QDC52662.1 cytochrome d ubiquinol oxidase subunit II [Methylophilus medardicus]